MVLNIIFRRRVLRIAAGITALALILLAGDANAASEYLPDSDTVLLDHFNNATSADYVNGRLNYVNSLPGLNTAADFKQGNWIRYAFQGWYIWSSNYDPSGKKGTVEMWVNPRKYNTGLFLFQWNYVNSAPSAGYTLSLGLRSDGKLSSGGWTAISGTPTTPFPVGKTTIPLNEWTHVAVTWGPSGTKLYVNGIIDAEIPDNLYPALNSQNYVYVNNWGESDLGYIDELRISKVARTEFSTIVQDTTPPTMTPTMTSTITPTMTPTPPKSWVFDIIIMIYTLFGFSDGVKPDNINDLQDDLAPTNPTTSTGKQPSTTPTKSGAFNGITGTWKGTYNSKEVSKISGSTCISDSTALITIYFTRYKTQKMTVDGVEYSTEAWAGMSDGDITLSNFKEEQRGEDCVPTPRSNTDAGEFVGQIGSNGNLNIKLLGLLGSVYAYDKNVYDYSIFDIKDKEGKSNVDRSAYGTISGNSIRDSMTVNFRRSGGYGYQETTVTGSFTVEKISN